MESMNDMLVELANQLGGAKKLGAKLWPELMADVGTAQVAGLFES